MSTSIPMVYWRYLVVYAELRSGCNSIPRSKVLLLDQEGGMRAMPQLRHYQFGSWRCCPEWLACVDIFLTYDFIAKI